MDVEQIERLYTVNLSKAYSHQRTKRAKWAISILRSFAAQHLKVADSDVKISTKLASTISARGIQSPLRSVKIRAIKNNGLVRIYLKDEKIEEPKAEEKKEESKETKQKKEEKSEENTEKTKKETNDNAVEKKSQG